MATPMSAVSDNNGKYRTSRCPGIIHAFMQKLTDSRHLSMSKQEGFKLLTKKTKQRHSCDSSQTKAEALNIYLCSTNELH